MCESLDLAPVIQCIIILLITFGCKLGLWVVCVVCVCVCVCMLGLFLIFERIVWKFTFGVLFYSHHLTISPSPFLLWSTISSFSSLCITIICFQNLHMHWGLKVLPLPTVLYSNSNPSLKLNDRNSKWQNCWNQLIRGEVSVLLISRNSSDANI